MYFPLLRNLSKYQIDPVAINLLDSWLAIQRKATLKNLTPLRFSSQTNIDLDLAIDMFFCATNDKIGVLRSRYRVLCPHCNNFISLHFKYEDIPNEDVTCKECNYKFIPYRSLDYVEIVFERILMPEHPLSHSELTRNQNEDLGISRNVPSLRVGEIITKPTARRLLFMGLDQRFDAAQ
ncbi:DUF5939 domain-containing protein [Brevibacillus halotolerans]|uniref:DUF5939 domain-containing protein n=1 Tax=Brevibacillus halotolerans TaxID=1507437 RepID=UPI0015EF1FB5|nr:DUF5939 domain-containing protein [Brevibacillus halotolerans]MBA4535151.1 hypothetical protein [Brevibacillus halotolerans]